MTAPPPLALATTAALLSACNIETLTQQFFDEHTRDTDSSSSSGGSSGADTSTTILPPASTSSNADADTGHTSSEPAETTGEASTTPDTTGPDTTSEPPALCGNAIREADEECDDPGDTHCFQCLRDHLVFVTSEDVQGDFSMSSLASLDYWCNHLAAVAGFLPDNQPRFKPWVSTTEASAAERLHHARGRYVLVNDLVFAESWDALIAGQILNPLNIDENGQTRNTSVFTDTRPDGSAMPGTHCDDWQSDDPNTFYYRGVSPAVDGSWTLYVGDASNPVPCDIPGALYCFESP